MRPILVTIVTCMKPEQRDLLEEIMSAYEEHERTAHPDLRDPIAPDDHYRFAYWLCRYSGLVERKREKA